jgi:hypothetical protein
VASTDERAAGRSVLADDSFERRSAGFNPKTHFEPFIGADER